MRDNELHLTEGKAWGRHLNTKISPTIHFPVSHYTVGYIVLAAIPECEDGTALVCSMRSRVSNVAVVPLLRFQKGNHLPNSWGLIAERHSIACTHHGTSCLGLHGSAAPYIIRSAVLSSYLV
jgi:hypothetical protein